MILSSVVNLLLWIAQIYVSTNFIIYSYRKLAWTTIQLRKIIEWHEDYPPYVVRMIGVIELLCGLGLILPYAFGILPILTIIDVFAMIGFMIIASIFHIKRKEYAAIVKEEPHYVLLLIFIAWGRLSQYQISYLLTKLFKVNLKFIDIFTTVLTALMMLSLGLSLTQNDLIEKFRKPKTLVLPLLFQMAALPLIAFFICFLTNLSPEFKMGIIILSSTPGGTTAGFISFLLKADVALSISLTAINSLLSLITIPLIVGLGFSSFMSSTTRIELPIVYTTLQILFIVIVPTCIGVAIRHKYLRFATNTEKIVKYALLILLPALFFIKFFAGEQYGGVNIERNDYHLLFPVTVIFN